MRGIWGRNSDDLRDVIEKQGKQLYKHSREIKRLHKVIKKLEIENEHLNKELLQYKQELYIYNGG